MRRGRSVRRRRTQGARWNDPAARLPSGAEVGATRMPNTCGRRASGVPRRTIPAGQRAATLVTDAALRKRCSHGYIRAARRSRSSRQSHRGVLRSCGFCVRFGPLLRAQGLCLPTDCTGKSFEKSRTAA
jgi:hypothetical protein